MSNRSAALLLSALFCAPAAWAQAAPLPTLGDGDATPAAGESASRRNEFIVGIGALTLAGDADLQVAFRPGRGAWEIAYRYLRTREEADDPFTGNELTESIEKITGPLVNYHFRPGEAASWYLGVGAYEWSKSHRSTVAGRFGEDSRRVLFFGGGYAGTLSGPLRYNLGLYVSPYARLSTGANARKDDDEIGVDVALQLGFAF